MASPSVAHPPIESLQAYNLGTLEDTKVQSVETHLEQCTACREQVEAMSARIYACPTCKRPFESVEEFVARVLAEERTSA